MPAETYSSLPNTVLAYKRDHRIGRFDPTAPEMQERKVREMWEEVERRGELVLSFSVGILFKGGKQRTRY